jgi:hypothetical protein
MDVSQQCAPTCSDSAASDSAFAAPVASERLTLSRMIASAASLLAACRRVATEGQPPCSAPAVPAPLCAALPELVVCDSSNQPLAVRSRALHVLASGSSGTLALCAEPHRTCGFCSYSHLLRKFLDLLCFRRQRRPHDLAGAVGAEAGAGARHGVGG